METLSGFVRQVSSPVSENPGLSFVREFAERYRGGSFDCVIGVGGGSAIDAAKMTAIFLANEAGALEDHLVSKKPFKKRGKLLRM